MMRAATGPVAYGIALAMTVTGIAAALACADGLTGLILTNGLNVTTFSGAFTHTSVLGQVGNEVKAVALGLIGVFGVMPAALGWVLEIIWRQATILVLVATVPITAAGLLAHSTASWFWRGLRWTIAAITVKPVLALIVVIGMSSLANATGPAGLLAGVAVLWVSLTSPIALFRLLAFVDPDTPSGQAFRDSFSQLSSRFGSSDSSSMGSGPSGGSGADSGGMSALESANTARFDAAGVGAGADEAAPAPAPASNSAAGAGTTASESTSGSPTTDNSGSNPGPGTDSGSTTGSGSDSGASQHDASGVTGGGMTDGGEPPVPAAAGPPTDTGPAHPSPHPRPAAGGSEGSGSGGAAAAGEEVAEAAVIL
jgi:hypothetical protein